MNGGVCRLQAQYILISCFESFQTGIIELILPLLDLLLDELVLLGAGQLLRLVRHALLQLEALGLGQAELALGDPHLALVAVVRLHGGVQLVQHPQDLLVQLLAHLAAAPVDALHVLSDARQPRHQLRRVHVRQAGVVAAQGARVRDELLPAGVRREEGPLLALHLLLLVAHGQRARQLVQAARVLQLHLRAAPEVVLQLLDQRHLRLEAAVQAAQLLAELHADIVEEHLLAGGAQALDGGLGAHGAAVVLVHGGDHDAAVVVGGAAVA